MFFKRRVRRNVWGNWNGYLGSKRHIEFGTDEVAAGYWLLTGSSERNAGYASTVLINQCKDAATRGSLEP